MRRNDMLRTVARQAGQLLDHADGALSFPPDISVTTASAEGAPGALVFVVGIDERADDLTKRLQEAGTAPAVLLLPWDASSLPVGDIVQGIAAAGHQVVGAVPLEEVDTPTALIVEPVGEGDPVLHPYLQWDGPARAIDRPALLRLVTEHVVEGYVWRATEQRLRAAEAGLGAADQARSAVEAELERLRAELAGLNARASDAENDIARLTAERDAARGTMDRIVASTSYRLARRMASGKQALGRIVGRGRS